MCPQKWPIARKENFFWGGPNGKVVALGIMVICPADKNCNYQTKNWILAPNIQIFGSKKHIFVPSGQVGPHQSMFSSRKRYLIGSLIWGYQKFCSIPPKKDFWPKTAKLGQNWHFLPNIGSFGPFDPMPNQKTIQTSCPGGFFYYVCTKTFTSLSKNRDFGPKKNLLLDSNHVLARNRKKCSKKKVPFSIINISLWRNFGCF